MTKKGCDNYDQLTGVCVCAKDWSFEKSDNPNISSRGLAAFLQQHGTKLSWPSEYLDSTFQFNYFFFNIWNINCYNFLREYFHLIRISFFNNTINYSKMGAPASGDQADLAAAYQELTEAEQQAAVSKMDSFSK